MDLLELFQLLLQACIVLASRALIICSSSLFCSPVLFLPFVLCWDNVTA